MHIKDIRDSYNDMIIKPFLQEDYQTVRNNLHFVGAQIQTLVNASIHPNPKRDELDNLQRKWDEKHSSSIITPQKQA